MDLGSSAGAASAYCGRFFSRLQQRVERAVPNTPRASRLRLGVAAGHRRPGGPESIPLPDSDSFKSSTPARGRASYPASSDREQCGRSAPRSRDNRPGLGCGQSSAAELVGPVVGQRIHGASWAPTWLVGLFSLGGRPRLRVWIPQSLGPMSVHQGLPFGSVLRRAYSLRPGIWMDQD